MALHETLVPFPSRRLKFQKRRQLFISLHNETLSGATMRHASRRYGVGRDAGVERSLERG